jgi:putative FmdB family regulatory protein
MPIYEYECRQCGARMERLIRSQADIPECCPACNAKKLQKVFSAFSVRASASSAKPACGACSADGACPYSGDACEGCE